jgi:hypothetical protein
LASCRPYDYLGCHTAIQNNVRDVTDHMKTGVTDSGFPLLFVGIIILPYLKTRQRKRYEHVIDEARYK